MRRSPEARAEADAVQQRHGSRKSGLPQGKRPRRPKTWKNAAMSDTTLQERQMGALAIVGAK